MKRSEQIHVESLSQIQRLPRDGYLPLSFAQQRLWFLNQLEPESAAYNLPSVVKLKGKVDIPTVKRTIQEVIRRHEILRTAYQVVDGEPMQLILPEVTFDLPVIDLRQLPLEEQKIRTEQIVHEEAQRPFNLTQGAIPRAVMIQLKNEEYLLVYTMHHIVSDGWSMDVLNREMGILYEAFITGRPSPLAELPVQYADFASWQRKWLQGDVVEQKINYWKQQLAGVPVLQLPTDYPRPAVQSSRGDTERLKLPRELADGLKRLSRQESATLFMTLLAAFQVLLHRYTGQEDICVGTPVSGRSRKEIEGLIGFFVNTLLIRTDLSGNPTFRELLGQVRTCVLQAFANQDVPFEKLVDELQPERELSHHPLFQVMFSMQSIVPEEVNRLAGLELSSVPVDYKASMFDLDLNVIDTQRGLELVLIYCTDLFNSETVRRMLGNYQRLLEVILSDPDQRVGELSLLTEEERQQILVEWNQTKEPYPQERCIHQLVEAQVKKTPDNVAAVFKGEALTYQELNRRANRMAWQLIDQGVGPNTVVGLLAERGHDFLTAILAVLKAGGAYLPIDPLYPAGRISQIVSNSQCPLVITSTNSLQKLETALTDITAENRPTVLSLETLLTTPSPEDNLPRRVTPSDLAYVIFTSGSTGVPKGVMIEHRGMLNHIYAKIRDLKLTSQDIISQTASQCFDISVWQFLTPLILGGQVFILPDEVAHDPAQLLAAVSQGSVTVLQVVPSQLRAILDETERYRYDLSALRWLIPTGEVLGPELCKKWLACYPKVPLVNAYGPTECSDDVSHHAIFTPDAIDSARIPIGRPINNTQLYVLDRHLQPVPVGVPGELHVGGVGVGRGYLNRPELTAERFIPDPFSQEPGARLYKTGDLVRYLPSGELDYLGRMDQQVKVRGYRVELGEIESVLQEHPTVRESVVIVKEDTLGHNLLVAYIVPVAERTPNLNDLTTFLSTKLPDYMLPSAFVFLEKMPTMPNGKINRKALPEPDMANLDLGMEFLAPRTPMESVLAAIWANVLNVDQISVNSNFFQIGGHSLAAAKVVNLINDIFQAEVPLRTLFESPTIAEFAGAILQDSVEQKRMESIAEMLLDLTNTPEDKMSSMLKIRRPSGGEAH